MAASRKATSRQATSKVASGGQSTNKDSLLAKATLISAIIAAAAAIVGPVIVHKLDDSSQAANLRQSTYNSFISQANSTESVLASTYNSVAATYKPSQSQQALAYFVRLTGTSTGQFTSAKDQVELVAPDVVVKAAKSVDAEISTLDEDYLTLIQGPDQGSESQLQKDTTNFGQAMTQFIRTAGGEQ